MKLLVAITSFGSNNDRFLERLIAEYRSMQHDTDIVIFSNVTKKVPDGVDLVVGLPSPDPWSLPFAHKRLLADKAGRYDLYIYSEDDILITEQNIRAFVSACSILSDNEIAGFLRRELDENGKKYYPDINRSFHWDPHSTVTRGGKIFGFFTCEHAACYVLTDRQLQRLVSSERFPTDPYEGKYDLACTAASDPYTKGGLKKLICISEIEEFVVSHLSNKYVGTDFDLEHADFERQVGALLDIHYKRRSSAQLLNPDTPFPKLKLAKNYYEPVSADVLGAVPVGAKTALSVGCGWGEMERCLVDNRLSVTSIPLDSVISACAEARGVRACAPDLDTAWAELKGERFDFILISNILHLVRDPEAILRECATLLSQNGTLVVVTPNFDYAKILWRRVTRQAGYSNCKNIGQYNLNHTSLRLVKKWFGAAGLSPTRIVSTLPERLKPFASAVTFGIRYAAIELMVIGRCRVNSESSYAGQA